MAYHTLTWLAWLAAAAYLALINQQPLQSALLILATGLVFAVASRRNPRGQGWGAFLRLGLWIWLVALAFNLLSVHVGARVLLTLPRTWPIIGGPITLEALLYGLASGANLFAVLLVFATFNLVVEAHRLLRWIPTGLYQAGLIVSIALTFVPQMIASLKNIREAQRVRGHQFRGLRDLIPLLVPLVTTALERALTLAESMEARGFGGIGRKAASAGHHRLKVVTLAAMLALLAGLIWPAIKPQARWSSLAWLGLGSACAMLTVHLRGRQLRRTHYHYELWRARDVLVSLACAASLLIVVLVQVRNPQALSYYPYPPFTPWPTFTLPIGLGALLLAAPAFLWPVNRRNHTKAKASETNAVGKG